MRGYNDEMNRIFVRFVTSTPQVQLKIRFLALASLLKLLFTTLLYTGVPNCYTNEYERSSIRA